MKTLSLAVVAIFCVTHAALAQDVRMNQADNASATQNNSTTQSETNHAVTPNAIIAAWNDSSQIATLGTAYTSLITWRASTDGGVSFGGGGFFTLPSGFICIGDPAVVADTNGFFYLAGLASNDGGNTLSNLAVARSTGTSAPFSFGAATILNPATPGDELDKELMAIDRTGGANNNRIYLVVRELGTERVAETHTTSLSPLTFSALQFISAAGGVATGAMPAVAPNGDVYVVWIRSGSAIEIVRSTNGGTSYVNPDSADPAAAKRIATVTAPSFLDAFGTMPIRVLSFPQIAIDSTAAGSPTRGNVYVVWHGDPDGAGPDKCDVFFSRSTDGGVTWAPARSISSGLAATLNPDTTTNDNWMPSIVVSPVTGHILVTFYDRRDDTTSTDGDAPNMKARLYRALSTDGGLTWADTQLGSSSFVPIAGFSQAGTSNNYWGEYNWSTANANGFQLTWGDSHNPCTPPPGAPNPCSPSGRPDLDAYYHGVANLSGTDLFIKPWGAVTGEGPMWQTPYIYVVDASNNQVNAAKGVVNHLRARVRNLGTAPASAATVRFAYAPWFAGVNDALFKEIGTATVNLSAAGGGTDDQIVPIDWDLTNTTDTNGGLWPAPISTFQHFCVKVSVEYASDINLSNNLARNNFFDVGTSAPTSAPLAFMIVGPPKGETSRPVLARLVVTRDVAGERPGQVRRTAPALPVGFAARLTVSGIETAAMKGFRINPGEIRLAKVSFVVPRSYRSARDVIANVTLLLDNKPSGGISARLYRSATKQAAAESPGAVKGAYWQQASPERVEQVKGQEPERQQPPKPRTIPGTVKFRRTLNGSYDRVFKGIVSVLGERKIGPALANHELGLINTTSTRVPRDRLMQLVADPSKVRANGHYFASLWLHPLDDAKVEVGVDAWIATSEIEAPMGRRLRSNGSVERSLLDAIARALR